MIFNIWSLTRKFRIEQEKKRIGDCINGDYEFFFSIYKDQIDSHLRRELEPQIRRELEPQIRRELESNNQRKQNNNVAQ